MGEVYSHLSEEERQVIQIEIGNGTSVRKMARLLGRSPSGISGEAKRNTWFPSDENGSCRPCRPKRLKTGPWTGGCCIAGPARRRADRRRAKPRKRYRLSCERLWARVAEWPGRGWSPPPVDGRPRVPFPNDPAMRVCPEAVCRWIHADRRRRERRARRLPAAAGGGAGVAAGGRRVSRFPDGLPSPSVRRRPATAAVSAIGRPTA